MNPVGRTKSALGLSGEGSGDPRRLDAEGFCAAAKLGSSKVVIAPEPCIVVVFAIDGT